MRDVEDRLRALGDATKEDSGTLSPSPAYLRRIRVHRILAVGLAVFSVVALGTGAFYASDLLRADTQTVAPPKGEESVGFARFFPTFGQNERAVLELSADSETVCYSLDSIQGYASFTRAAIVQGRVRNTSSVELFPNANAFTPNGGGDCIRNADGSMLQEIIERPDGFFLLVESPGDGELVTSLMPVGNVDKGPPTASDFGAIWPEDTADQAKQACSKVTHARDGWRRNAASTALHFGREVLEWDDPLAIVRKRSRTGWDVELRESNSDDADKAEGAAVIVYASDIFGNCWSVEHVSHFPVRDPGLSVGINGRTANVVFGSLGADSATIEFGYAGRIVTKSWEEGMEQPVFLPLGFEPDTTGHFLILLRDASGAVFSAKGLSLPKGDFAAG